MFVSVRTRRGVRSLLVPVAVVTGALAFCVLLTLNSGGYHYAVSDQAFYIPVVLDELEPALFPHAEQLIGAQDRLLLFDDWFAPLVRLTGWSLPVAFLIAHLLTLLILYGAFLALGKVLYRSWWTIGGLLVVVTLRHRIPHTGANSVEGYFHPRLLAFAVGLSALGFFLSGRTRWAFVVVALAMLVHPTIGGWFLILIGGAAICGGGLPVKPAVGGILLGGGVVLFTLGESLWDQFVSIDEIWFEVLAVKDYLVVAGWPWAGWLSNFTIAAVGFGIFWYRRMKGVATEHEAAVMGGVALLLAVFLVSAPFSIAGVALAVQLQVNRVFWLTEMLTLVLAVWLVFEGPGATKQIAVPRRLLVLLFVLLATLRGGYRGFVEQPDRPLVEVGLADTDWSRLMDWAAQHPIGTHFLADPGHAARYGSSVRAASRQDVYLEVVKDSALAIYSREVAHRVARRIEDIGDFEELTPLRARTLAGRYALDYLITEQRLALPRVGAYGPLQVYALREGRPGPAQ